MPDSSSTGPERAGQSWFIFRTLLGCVLIWLIVANARFELTQTPNRQDLGAGTATLRLEPIGLRAQPGSPFAIAGAWQVSGNDPRVGGISGLAINGGMLIAINDNGSVISFPKPQGHGTIEAAIRDVPAGPASPRFKAYRDSEAIVRDPHGRGWWISFEHVNHFWLYDFRFARALQRIRHGARVLPYGNRGFEAGVADGGNLLFFDEAGRIALRGYGSDFSADRIAGPGGAISDLAAVSPGRVLAIERKVTALGFRNRLVPFTRTATGYAAGTGVAIPASWRDNFEALAIDRSGAGTRLWLMSDDSFEPPYRTVLLALDVDEKWLEAA